MGIYITNLPPHVLQALHTKPWTFDPDHPSWVTRSIDYEGCTFQEVESFCKDCGSDYTEPYVIKDALWTQYAGDMDQDGVYEPAGPMAGILCIACLERRMGRRLQVDDLTPKLLVMDRPPTWNALALHLAKPTPQASRSVSPASCEAVQMDKPRLLPWPPRNEYVLP